MHAALEAPTLDAACEAFGVVPDPVLVPPELYAENRSLMAELRQRLGRT